MNTMSNSQWTNLKPHKMLDITAIVLTFNEELHIKRCIACLNDVVKQICIIDSFSTDKTIEIASQYPNVQILQHKWENSYSKQFNWGLNKAPIKTKWVLRMDADEYLTDELKAEMMEKMPSLPDDVTACSILLRHVFMGRILRRGMPVYRQMRLFVYGAAECEARFMDEHIQLTQGRMIELNGEFADDNLNNLSWWAHKHVNYAIREAVDLLDIEYDLTGATKLGKQLTKDALAKRKRKHSYAKKSLFWRSFAYFVYRYIFRMGFMDGKEGFIWHFMQAWWYRALCDAKVYEIKKACGDDKEKMIKLLKEQYNIDLKSVAE